MTDLASVGNAMLQDPGSVLQVAGGLGLATVGAGGEAVGGLLDVTGIGAVVGVPAGAVSAAAIAGGLGMAGAGASDIIKDAAGPDRVHMESEGGGGGAKPPEDNGHTLPQRDPDPDAKASGKPEAISKNADPTTVRALTRQNEAADKLAQHGYDVEHSPEVPGSKILTTRSTARSSTATRPVPVAPGTSPVKSRGRLTRSRLSVSC
ncbi:hypothetical protein [Streptomyces lydicus]|uniref:hypothetical protein n=1 Tax=Streptomyces lydicus TaxID=47763 RepID=UPI00379B7734